jgi:Holliday junction DNA helicase RuvB
MKTLDCLEIDEEGLDEMDKKIMDTIVNKFSGGPVGIASLAVSVGEERDTIEEVYEPYLIQAGYLARTTRGRVATRKAFSRFADHTLLGGNFGGHKGSLPLFDESEAD